MFAPCYFDHNATTPLGTGVLDSMLPWLQVPANPSSRHEYGRAALEAVGRARQQVAQALGAEPSEIIFTSGGTEAANLFIKGVAMLLPPTSLAVSAIEHPCVMQAARQLERFGWRTQHLAVDELGRVNPDALAVASESTPTSDRPSLVSVMLANNETGVVQDVQALARAARKMGAVFGTDAVQAFGKIPLNFRALNRDGVNALWVSAHKIGGPRGIGALVVDKRIELFAQIAGGGQERGLRSGTENVAAIVGFGVACERFCQGTVLLTEALRQMRNRLEAGLVSQGAVIFAQQAERLPNTVFFAFPGIEGETLVGKLDRAGFAVASGSACSSAQPEPSHVLRAMGVEETLAQGSVRVSLGEGNTPEEIEQFLLRLQATVNELRTLTAIAVNH